MTQIDSLYSDGPGRVARAAIFAGKFFRHGRRVASIAPSSPLMSKALAGDVDPTRRQTIVELGAGTGCVTRAIAKRMHPESRLVALELDRQLAGITHQRCPRAEVHCADAGDLAALLADAGVDRMDVLVNCLPTPSLPARVNQAIYDAADARMTELRVRQLTEMPLLYWRAYRRLFEHVRFVPVPLNIPPSGVFVLRGLKPGYTRWLSTRRGFCSLASSA